MKPVCTILSGVFLLLLCAPAIAQPYGSHCTAPPMHFQGKAPAPWAIDGSTADWESFMNTTNKAADGTCKIGNTGDADHPDPTSDIRQTEYTYDDYNIYFRLHRPVSGGGLKTFFYFLDINADGFMAEGEPVIRGSFNSNELVYYSLGYYVPNTSTDYVNGKGNHLASPQTGLVDGYTMVGSVKELFNYRRQGSLFTLGPNEVFLAEVTADGYGVEFAVPWSFLRNYTQNTAPLNSSSLLLYHAALQSGGGNYTPANVTDNAGCCFGQAQTIGFTAYTVQNRQLSTLVAGSSYQMSFELLNISATTEVLSVESFFLSDLQTASGSPINKAEVQVIVYKDANCNGTIDNDETGVTFQYKGGTVGDYFVPSSPLYTSTASGDKACFIARLNFPEGVEVTSFKPEFGTNISSPQYGCSPVQCADGGRPINPVGFTQIAFTNAARVPVESTTASLIDRVTVYPNPTKGTAHISLPSGTGSVDILVIDYTGRVVRSLKSVTATQLQLADLSSGMYSIQVKDRQTGKEVTRKLVVQQ